MQLRVRQRFEQLQQLDKVQGNNRVPWHIVSAAQSIEQVQAEINKIVDKTLAQVQSGKQLGKLWEEGAYQATTSISIAANTTTTTTTTTEDQQEKENVEDK